MFPFSSGALGNRYGLKTGILGPEEPKNVKIAIEYLRNSKKVIKTMYTSILNNYQDILNLFPFSNFDYKFFVKLIKEKEEK